MSVFRGGPTPTGSDLIASRAEFRLNNLRVSQQNLLTPTGISPGYVVTYSLGVHGPFSHEYPGTSFDPAQVHADILRDTENIQAVTAFEQAGATLGRPPSAADLTRSPQGRTTYTLTPEGQALISAYPDLQKWLKPAYLDGNYWVVLQSLTGPQAIRGNVTWFTNNGYANAVNWDTQTLEGYFGFPGPVLLAGKVFDAF